MVTNSISMENGPSGKKGFRKNIKQALMSLLKNLMNVFQEIIMLILSYGY